MGPPRSTAPRTLGTLSMVFGGLITATSFFGLVFGKQIGQMSQVQPSQQEAFDQYIREIHGVSTGLSAMMLVMSIALFIIGTGQRGFKRWAINASIIWGAVALVCLAINLIVQLTVILPALDRFIERISHGGSVKLPLGNIMKVSTIVGVLFYAPYPIILIAAFRKPNVREVMDQPPKPTPAADVFQ